MIKSIGLNVLYSENKITIPSNQNGRLIFSWKDVFSKDFTIEIADNSSVEILELGEVKDNNFQLIVSKNSHVVYNIFSENEGYDSNKKITLLEGSHLVAGLADFSYGKKNLHVDINLKEKNSYVEWHLASLSQNDDKKVYNVNIVHEDGFTKAIMNSYGVCKNESTLEFLGDAIIKKNAKKASTKQNAKIMVFDKKCHAKASPKLCIYENDVEASHGASEGQINPDHIYYLMTRGIPEEEAKKLITLGYLNPITSYFFDEKIKEDIRNSIIKEI